MDIQTGPGLIAAIAETINRDDLMHVIPAWVQMSERGFDQVLRVREQVKRSTVTATASYVPLPEDFAQMKSVRINDPVHGPTRLTLASEDSINDPRLRGAWSPFPKFFTIVGNEIELSPFKDGSTFEVEMTYFSTIPKLNTTTPGSTTWLLQRAPTLYLYSALAHSAPFLNEDPRLEMWATWAAQAMDGLNKDYETSRLAGSTLKEVRKSLG